MPEPCAACAARGVRAVLRPNRNPLGWCRSLTEGRMQRCEAL